MVSFLQSLLLLFHFCVFPSQLSERVWKLAEEISLQSASKRFPSFSPPANDNKSNAKKSLFRPNRNLTRTIYHWSVILRRVIVILNLPKRDANVIFNVLLLSSHLLISRHPVRKSITGAVTGYCSVRSLHFQSQMTQASRIHAVNIRLKQTGLVNFSRRQYCRLCGEVVLSPQSLRPLLASYSVNYFFDHNHTCGLLNISALHVQYGIQAFAKS